MSMIRVLPAFRGLTRVGVVAMLTVACPARLPAQGPSAPVIDSIIVETTNVFDPAMAETNVLFRIANALHFTTRPSVVRSELLLKQGDRWDGALLEESLRNLRARGLFRDVQADTIRAGDRLHLILRTYDGWSTQLVLNAGSVAGEVTWAIGGQERNVLGLGARLGVVYKHEVDRNSMTFRAGHNRIGGTRAGFDVSYEDLSDGNIGTWGFGVPFRALSDRHGVYFTGEVGRQRTLQFRNSAQLAEFQRRVLSQRVDVAVAPMAGANGYLRVGMTGEIRREDYRALADSALAIPDTVRGAVGLFGEWMSARFKVVTHYNGFARERDLDLSTKITLIGWAAPSGFGYERSGIGPSLTVVTGFDAGPVFGWVLAHANGLFTAAGLDSGQVKGAVTVAVRGIPRAPTVLHLQAAARRGQAPGQEYDLGHGIGPRGFASHAFTGNRTVWGSIEQRVFPIDEVIGLFGVGFAAFLDYGGAWYSDQAVRLGGNVGFGLRIGATRSAGPSVGRFDVVYRFGDGLTGGPWAMSFGRGFAF